MTVLLSAQTLTKAFGPRPLCADLAFDPQKVHEPTALEYKEYDTGRRHPWAEDRVM